MKLYIEWKKPVLTADDIRKKEEKKQNNVPRKLELSDAYEVLEITIDANYFSDGDFMLSKVVEQDPAEGETVEIKGNTFYIKKKENIKK